jgi:hypothetical protein
LRRMNRKRPKVRLELLHSSCPHHPAAELALLSSAAGTVVNLGNRQLTTLHFSILAKFILSRSAEIHNGAVRLWPVGGKRCT